MRAICERSLGQRLWSLTRAGQVRDRFEGPAQLSITIPSTTAGQGGIPVQVASAGKDDGDFASVLVDGEQVARNERGINIVVFDCGTGTSGYSVGCRGACRLQEHAQATFVRRTASTRTGRRQNPGAWRNSSRSRPR